MAVQRASSQTVGAYPEGKSVALTASNEYAIVSATTGSPSTGNYTDSTGARWTYYKWVGAGSFTLSIGGLVRYLIVGGGAQGASSQGGGGGVLDRTGVLAAGTYTVTVGAGGSTSGGFGGQSSISSTIYAGGGNNNATAAGNGQWSSSINGLFSDISGTSVGYGGATGATSYGAGANGATTPVAVANSGGGGYNQAGVSTGNGADGVVYIAVMG